MKRRSFLQSGSALTIPFFINGLPISAFSRSHMFNSLDDNNDNVLVLIQLNGGNDGLNMIIPLDKYDLLSNVRSNIIIPQNDIINIEQNFGLHPNMQGIKSLYDDAKMTVVQDVGYPNQNRSHFRSTDIWTSGSPADEFWSTGWLGRYLENRFPEFPEGYPNDDCPDPFAISIGSTVHETCQGSSSNYSIALRDPFSLAPLAEGGEDEAPDTPYGMELEFLRAIIAQSNAYADNVSDAANMGTNMSLLYNDDNNLAQQLKTIALLIAGGLRTRIFIANIGGFDTHANQVVEGETTTGDHAVLMQSISEAVTAFQDDLTLMGLEEKVMTMTFSEFGRRIRSNDSLGTDHGTAAPIMLFGSCVNPGIIGESPELPQNPSFQDGVPMQFDFRSIYGSILMDWFGVDQSEIRQILFEDFQYIPIIKSCNQTTANQNIEIETIEISSYPNPCTNWMTISFESKGEHIRLSLFDALGQELKVITNQHLQAGNHNIKIETSSLSSGNYFYQIIGNSRMKTKGFIKI